MNLTTLIVQLIGGALGGYAAGNVSKEMNLGTIGNAIVGGLGGGVGGQVFFLRCLGRAAPYKSSQPYSQAQSAEGSLRFSLDF
jgi:uncharacterized membrane protein YeaQ/YmgE (transglycosylase-associated protein family)